MEYITDEINLQPPQTEHPTQAEIDTCLELLNWARIRSDLAAIDFKRVTEKPDVKREDVKAAFNHRQIVERQYMMLCNWIWDYTPYKIVFDHEQQKYFLCLRSSL